MSSKNTNAVMPDGNFSGVVIYAHNFITNLCPAPVCTSFSTAGDTSYVPIPNHPGIIHELHAGDVAQLLNPAYESWETDVSQLVDVLKHSVLSLSKG